MTPTARTTRVRGGHPGQQDADRGRQEDDDQPRDVQRLVEAVAAAARVARPGDRLRDQEQAEGHQQERRADADEAGRAGLRGAWSGAGPRRAGRRRRRRPPRAAAWSSSGAGGGRGDTARRWRRARDPSTTRSRRARRAPAAGTRGRAPRAPAHRASQAHEPDEAADQDADARLRRARRRSCRPARGSPRSVRPCTRRSATKWSLTTKGRPARASSRRTSTPWAEYSAPKSGEHETGEREEHQVGQQADAEAQRQGAAASARAMSRSLPRDGGEEGDGDGVGQGEDRAGDLERGGEDAVALGGDADEDEERQQLQRRLQGGVERVVGQRLAARGRAARTRSTRRVLLVAPRPPRVRQADQGQRDQRCRSSRRGRSPCRRSRRQATRPSERDQLRRRWPRCCARAGGCRCR